MDTERTREQINEKVYKDSGLGRWFNDQSADGKPGWDRYNTKGERVGKCGDSKPGEGKPKCLSRQKAAKLRRQGGKKAIANAVKRKRAKDPVQDRPGTGNKPKNVSNNIKEGIMEKLNIKNIQPEMVVVINEELCIVRSVNRIGDSSYCLNYINENKNYAREFFLTHDSVTIADELETIDIQEKKETKKPLGKPFRTPGGPKKFSVYVKNEKGNVVKVNFGDPNMEIKRDDPKRRKSFRARHNCDNPGPRTKARYWSCYQWRGGKKVEDNYQPEGEMLSEENKPTNPSLWSRAKALAKKKFDVYPSAYANAWASKWYKKKGGGWKKAGKKKVNEGYLDNKRLDKEERLTRDDISTQIANMGIFNDEPKRKKLAQIIMGTKRLYTKDREEKANENI